MYQIKEHCYVLPDINKIHQITYDRHDFVWYPERGMSLVSQMSYLPYVQSIVTESPWLIAMYPRERVRVWDKIRGWIEPNIQTYGADMGTIMSMMGYNCSIPAMALDGGKSLLKKIKKMEKEY